MAQRHDYDAQAARTIIIQKEPAELYQARQQPENLVHMGQMHGPKYIPRLFGYTRRGQIDPSFCVTHRFRLDDVTRAYSTFKSGTDDCVKVLVEVD
ncbi:MAG: hypothetical protein MUC88_08570 [Planctomycetes bacterium]|jgi:threonine dehydrogenase-like Zn-dependent dehydrogenase|nr:hypothetical protein [Planctomycetota bacterium]